MTTDDCPPAEADAILPAVGALQRSLGAEWTAVEQCRARTVEAWRKLDVELRGICSSDVSVVLFGSIARGEMTAESDADWALLVDGQAQPDHAEVAQAAGERILQVVQKLPGREGVFGNMAFSHDLIQLIGGEDDTNRNLTRRNLLLLESKPFGRTEAHQRTLEQVLHRYVAEDLDHANADREFYVPRFLLNDFARFWRTMAVDFAYKRKGRHSSGIALRNVKLRMSRKLLFVSGLIACFACELGLPGAACNQDPRRPVADRCQTCLLPFFREPPLENMATLLMHLLNRASGNAQRSQVAATARKAFDAYDAFLALLNDSEKRGRLDALTGADLDTDCVFDDARKISRSFRDALDELFFATDERMTRLVKKYGVF